MESINNRNFIPLLSGRIYIGEYDNVTSFSSATISMNADTNCEIIAYQSQNKSNTYTKTWNTAANHQFTSEYQLTAPYVYFTVRNTSGSNQTVMAFTVIYRNVNGTISTLSNISDTNGNPILSTNGLLQVQDILAENSLASLVNGITINNFPEEYSIRDTTGQSIVSTAGLLQVQDTLSEGYLSSIVNGLYSALTVNIHDGSGNVLNSTNNSLNNVLFDAAGYALGVDGGAGSSLDVFLKNQPTVNIASSGGENISAANNCMNVAIFDSAGNAFTGTTPGILDVNIVTPLIALDSSIQTLINQNLNNGGYLNL